MMNSYQQILDEEAFIAIAEETERNFWAAKLGVSTEQLKSAVRATRSLDLANIKNYLINNTRKSAYN